MAFFSIIVPVYNVEEYLPQCVNSILNQTFSDFELLLIDDGSPDNSGKLCDRYTTMDQRIQVVHKENGGLSSARNYGMRMAKGTFIVFLDSDDYWDRRDALELIYKEISATNCDVVLLKHRKLNIATGQVAICSDFSSTEDIKQLSYAEQLKFCVSRQLFDTCAWNKAFRRDLMQKRDLYFIEGIIAEDLDWAARLSLVATNLAVVREPVHIYRKGRPGAITSSLKLKNLIDTKGSIERCLSYISNTQMDSVFSDGYYSYIAYRYMIWMAESAAVKDLEKKILIHEMQQYVWLLEYSANRKVELTKKMVHVFGFTIASKLLGVYLLAKG